LHELDKEVIEIELQLNKDKEGERLLWSWACFVSRTFLRQVPVGIIVALMC